MTIEETKKWIDEVNSGTGNPNRTPELKENSKPCSEMDTFLLTVEQVGPDKEGQLEVGTADRRFDPGDKPVVIPAQSNKVKSNVKEEESKE